MSSGQENPRRPSQTAHEGEGTHTPSGMSRHYLAEGPGVEKAAPIVDYVSHKRPDDPDYIPEACGMPGVDIPDEGHPDHKPPPGEKPMKGQQEGMGGSMGGQQGSK